MSNEIRNNININIKFFRQIVLTLYNNIYNLFKKGSLGKTFKINKRF
jgi:hypothetical protein